MIEIPVGLSRVALVDDRDADLVASYVWRAHTIKGSARVYARHQWTEGNKNKAFFMHNLILGERGVDHIDRDGLNNQRSNLRIADKSQNQVNTLPRSGSSRFKGVSRMPDCDRWRAGIRKGGRRIHLGLFNDEVLAAQAYDQAALELYGEYAVLNLPEVQT